MPADSRARLLIAPDRDGAESAAEAVAEAGLTAATPRIVREALAGEDDAEDAQWLAIVTAPGDGWTATRLAALADIAAEHDGWVETDGPLVRGLQLPQPSLARPLSFGPERSAR